jgi:hypothetical protein
MRLLLEMARGFSPKQKDDFIPTPENIARLLDCNRGEAEDYARAINYIFHAESVTRKILSIIHKERLKKFIQRHRGQGEPRGSGRGCAIKYHSKAE